MKILLLSPCHPNFGGWYRADSIARELYKRGHEVTFIHPASHTKNLFSRLKTGLEYLWHVMRLKYDVVHLFEIVQPENALAGILCLLLRRNVVLDVGDDWDYALTTFPKRHPLRFCFFLYLRFFDHLILRHFVKLTATSTFLLGKYSSCRVSGCGVKLINGINFNEFEPFTRSEARKELGIAKDARLMLSFGNTFGGDRQRLLTELVREIKTRDAGIHFLPQRRYEGRQMALWLAATNIILFPTGNGFNEQACFPIRVGTILNAERVIATDTYHTEFHDTLKPYDCMVQGWCMSDLADKVVKFLNNPHAHKYYEENVRKAKKDLGWNKLIGALEELYGMDI